MVELAMLQELETVAHLREMAACYRQLATATWDTDVLKILNDMSRDYDNEAHAIERGGEANDDLGSNPPGHSVSLVMSGHSPGRSNGKSSHDRKSD